jgi:SpoVK/Ycf46/Vps4 family AAA+-type ATPase
MLLDEVEKEINAADDSGVSSRMLATLLWWLAERKAKVITVMTTNAKEKLPPELYRPGRIDRVVEVGPIEKDEAGHLIDQLMDKYGLEIDKEDQEYLDLVSELIGVDETSTPAKIEHAIFDYIRSKQQ